MTVDSSIARLGKVPDRALPVAGIAARGSWPFVGRATQFALVRSALRSSSAKALLLCGPSGIGKSRLAREAAAEAAASRHLVLHAAADSALADIPLGALLPVLPGAVIDTGALAQHPGALFESTRQVLQREAAGRPVLLVVDDLGSLDRLSLALVAQLLAAGVLRLIATLRDGEPIPDTVLSLWTGGSGVRIDLPPLSLHECTQLLAAMLDSPVAHRAVVALHDASRGNPLMLRELVEGAREAGHLQLRRGIWQLDGPPQGTMALHDLIRARFEKFDASDTALIRRLAVCHTLTFEEAIGDGDIAHAAQLEQAGVISIRENEGTIWLTLGHPQYGEAIRSSLSKLERIGILTEQARASEAISTKTGSELRIAVWLLDAGRPGSAASLARAARLAALAQDYPMVCRFAAAAVVAGGADPDMLLLQGYALWVLGRGEEAIPVLEAARAADRAAPGTRRRAVSIASALASACGERQFGEARALAIIDEVIAERPELSGELSSQRAFLLTYIEQADAAAAAFENVEPRTADGEDDPWKVATALSKALIAAAQGRSAHATVIAEAAVHAAMFENEPVTTLRRAHVIFGMVQLWCSQLIAAEATANLALAEAIEVDDEPMIAYAQMLLADCALAQGRLHDCERWCREVLGSAGAEHQARLRNQASARLALALVWQGRVPEARTVRDGFHEDLVEHDSIALLASVWVDVASGDGNGCVERLVQRAASLEARGNRALAAVLLHSVSRLGEAAMAAPLLQRIDDETDSRDIALLTEHAVAEAEQDVDRLTAVAVEWQRLGSHILAAEAFTSAALHTVGRPATRMRQTAAHLRGLADDACTPMLERLGEPVPLTPREREIAALARTGQTTGQIAERLTLSRRTVDNHLHSVYQKLGVASRAEL